METLASWRKVKYLWNKNTLSCEILLYALVKQTMAISQ